MKNIGKVIIFVLVVIPIGLLVIISCGVFTGMLHRGDSSPFVKYSFFVIGFDVLILFIIGVYCAFKDIFE